MKKLILLAVMAVIMLSVNAQVPVRNSIVLQPVDSLTLEKVTKIENSLSGYYKENRNSQFFILLGSALITAGYIFNDQLKGEVNVLPIVGGISSLVGGILYLDSFKYLNPKRKTKVNLDNW